MNKHVNKNNGQDVEPVEHPALVDLPFVDLNELHRGKVAEMELMIIKSRDIRKQAYDRVSMEDSRKLDVLAFRIAKELGVDMKHYFLNTDTYRFELRQVALKELPQSLAEIQAQEDLHHRDVVEDSTPKTQ